MNADRLRELLEYNEETGEFLWRVSRGSRSSGSKAGCASPDGYVRISVDNKDYSAHRLAWIYLYGEWPIDQIDHINGVKSDNRIANLRLADNSQNNMNRSLQANSSSGFKGVSLHRPSGLWFAYVNKGGKRHSAGYHKTPESGYLASCELRDILHKNFARHDLRLPKGEDQ